MTDDKLAADLEKARDRVHSANATSADRKRFKELSKKVADRRQKERREREAKEQQTKDGHATVKVETIASTADATLEGKA